MAKESVNEPDKKQIEANLAVEAALRVLGGKWKILILWHLKDSPRRYSELRRRIPGISEKMLIQQLRELEHDDIISRTVYDRVPPQVEYAPTTYGRSLDAVLHVLCDWGCLHRKRFDGHVSGVGARLENDPGQ